MENVREVVTRNLLKLRKKNKLTQAELAEKLNYSDKAVSRWESGEVVPDVETLNKIAEVYQVELSALFDADLDTENMVKLTKAQTANRVAIVCLGISIVWLIAVVAYIYIYTFNGFSAWQSFIYAVPATFLIGFIFNRKWGSTIGIYVFSSLFLWTGIAALYVALLKYDVWLVFILGIPIQAIVILYSQVRRGKKIKKIQNAQKERTQLKPAREKKAGTGKKAGAEKVKAEEEKTEKN